MMACEAVSLALYVANRLLFPSRQNGKKCKAFSFCFYSLGFRLRVMLSVLERNANGLIKLHEML